MSLGDDMNRATQELAAGSEERQAQTLAAIFPPQEWRVVMRAEITIRSGQTLFFVPPIGAMAGEPNPFQAIAQKYNGQKCTVEDVVVQSGGRHVEILVRFEDGYKHSMWTEYLYAPRE